MKIACISGNLPHYDRGLGKLLTHAKNIFTELGVQSSELNLGIVHPPYFDGVKNTHLDGLLAEVREAQGVVLACTAELFAPSAIMQTFIEYLALPAYADLLQGKCVALLVISDTGGEKSALAQLAQVVQYMGAFAVTQIGLQGTHLDGFIEGNAAREFVEKELEDFYRAVRQNRVRIIPRDAQTHNTVFTQSASTNNAATHSNLSESVAGNGFIAGLAKVLPQSPAAAKRLDAFTEQQEREIEELSRLFAEKYADEEDETDIPTLPTPSTPPRKKSARQLTQSLPHYFQPQLSSGTQATIQISISGNETFEGFLTILNKECSYTDGEAEAPDVTVVTDAALWLDVLNAKLTAQKAFMIGGLKVRGALALFTKFDTLFKLN